MSSYSVQLYNRDFSNILTPYTLVFEPDRLGWDAVGGCSEAVINVTGPEIELWELIERLRSPIEVVAPDSKVIWWGYVEEVEIQTAAISISVSLEKMSNRVCVTYSEVNVAGSVGERKTTTWYIDADSVSTYGTKEQRFSKNQGTASEAENYAQTQLERVKFPIASHHFQGGGRGTGARLTCSGWWQTLDWKYYENSGGKVSYEETGTGLTSMGDANARKKLAQSFQTVGGTVWEAQSVKIRMKKEKSPTDNLVVGLYSDSAGVPGSLLASATLSGANVNENLNWHELQLNTKVALTVATTYWIMIERSGAVDGTNYYKIDANEALGYASGVMRIWNNSAWVARSPDADMLFQVGGVEETTTQIERMITTSGQFISGVEMDISSGVFSSPYRDGDQYALSCIEELLDSGTTNLRRLLSRVDNQRRVEVFEEPVSGDRDYYLHSNGKLHDWLDRQLNAWDYPVGVWARLADVIPASADTSKIADPSKVFIEKVTFNVSNNSVILQEREYSSLLEID